MLTEQCACDAPTVVGTVLRLRCVPKPYNSTTDDLDKLCKFFDCSLSEIAEYVSDDVAPANPQQRAS